MAWEREKERKAEAKELGERKRRRRGLRLSLPTYYVLALPRSCRQGSSTTYCTKD